MKVEEKLVECARSMSGTFTRQEIVSWFRRHHPEVKESTLGAYIQALTSNSTNRERNHPGLANRTPLFDRVGHGLYRVHQPGGATATSALRHVESPSLVPSTVVADHAPSSTPWPEARDEWHWEGNAQAAVVTYLASQGWGITRVADTASREHGTDIEAARAGRRVHVEVKGWPSERYVNPARAHETKRTSAPVMARSWFSDGVVHVLRLRNSHPADAVVLAMPGMDTYRRLVDGVRHALEAIRITVLWLDEDGSVSVDIWDMNAEPGEASSESGEKATGHPS